MFSVKPSDIFKGYNKDFLLPEQLFQEKEFERLIRQMESEGLIHVVPPNTGILRQICAVPERWEDYYACLNRTEKNILKNGWKRFIIASANAIYWRHMEKKSFRH